MRIEVGVKFSRKDGVFLMMIKLREFFFFWGFSSEIR